LFDRKPQACAFQQAVNWPAKSFSITLARTPAACGQSSTLKSEVVFDTILINMFHRLLI
jgi:hypothetical protein